MTKRNWRFNSPLSSWVLLSWLFLFPLGATLGQPANMVFQRASWDTIPTRPATFRWVAPAVLIPIGLALSPDYPNSHFDRFYVRSEIQDKIHFRTHADDFLQYGPAVAWAGLSLAGVNGRSKPLDRAIIGVLAYGISTGAILVLKHTTNELRPDGSNTLSFPSGHTANAFTGASLLDREFSSVSPWIPIGGYAMATSTGILRMTNDKHWLSDVLVGAGIGLLSTEIAYQVYPWLTHKLGRHRTTSH
ncbi:phosphatase PAP2 family protein [Spirosoma linguale]|uniref:Phosphoesterase PA-phosphatase related protein n=1 Tax=Spirosoma linguale (strain ATCC 33905 / DSM 74 / LMG 10896 / Claus 1) TaxID=504472 RepID=D2QV59_SPILD|nr:phosphoesterase PA-phosphatase related protein [Spirosoma linguale DSM 74]